MGREIYGYSLQLDEGVSVKADNKKIPTIKIQSENNSAIPNRTAIRNGIPTAIEDRLQQVSEPFPKLFFREWRKKA